MSAAVNEPERIVLELSDAGRFASAARMLVGGLATRLQCSYESLDDLQLAVEAVIGDGGHSDRLMLELVVREGGVEILMGPVRADLLDLDTDQGGPEHRGIPLGMLFATVVDEAEVVERQGTSWIRLDKALLMPATQ